MYRYYLERESKSNLVHNFDIFRLSIMAAYCRTYIFRIEFIIVNKVYDHLMHTVCYRIEHHNIVFFLTVYILEETVMMLTEKQVAL